LLTNAAAKPLIVGPATGNTYLEYLKQLVFILITLGILVTVTTGPIWLIEPLWLGAAAALVLAIGVGIPAIAAVAKLMKIEE
jgi:hypothetical protein